MSVALVRDVPVTGRNATGDTGDARGTRESVANARTAEGPALPAEPWRSSVAFVQETEADVSWIVGGVLPAGAVVLLSGREGSMKTWLALSLARAVAAGVPWLGHDTKQGRVLYLDGEMPPAVLKQRLQALGLTEDLHVWSWTYGTFPQYLNHPDLRRAAESHTLIVVDTLRRHMKGLKENNADDMAAVTDALRELTRHDAAVLVLHHAAKDADRPGYRGSTELGAGVDIAVSLTAKTSGSKKVLRLETHKTRYPLSADLEIVVTDGPDAPGFTLQSGGQGKGQERADSACLDLRAVVKALTEQLGTAPTQGQVVKAAGEKGLGGKDKIRRMLEDGAGKYWKKEQKGTSVRYTPIEA